MRRLFRALGPAGAILALTLGLTQSASGQGFDNIHDCTFCHSLHGSFSFSLLAGADAETVCLSCHGEFENGTAAGGSDTKAEVHFNWTTTYAPFYITCLRCHGPHVDLRNWLPGHTDVFSGTRPPELDEIDGGEGFNVKHIGRPYPVPPNVGAGQSRLARGTNILAEHTVILTVGPIAAGVDLIDGGETAGVHAEDSFLRNDGGDWTADYEIGARVTVANVTQPCGFQLFRDASSFRVTSVTADTLGVEGGALFPTPPPTVGPLPRRSGFDFVDGGAGDDSIERTDGGSWIADGFRAGCDITVSGAEDPLNDGTYTLTSVTAIALGLASGSVTTPTTDDNQAVITAVQGTQLPDTTITFDGVVNAYTRAAGDWSDAFAVGQGIVVEGFAGPDGQGNNGFATVQNVTAQRIVVWPYRIDPANDICPADGAGGPPCSLLVNPDLTNETPSGEVVIYPSATILSVELDPTANGTPDRDPDGIPVGPHSPGFDFVDGGGGDDSIVRNDGGSWIDDGYRTGGGVDVAGSALNDGTYTITSASDTTLGVPTASLQADTGDTNATFDGPLLADPDCLTYGNAETNCCYTSGRRQVVFEQLNAGSDWLHSFADENMDTLVGPNQLSPDPLIAFGSGGAGGFEAGTGAWDGGCGEACHTVAAHHRNWCQEDPGTGLCDTSGDLGHDSHNSQTPCTNCHTHVRGFARGNNPVGSVLGPCTLD